LGRSIEIPLELIVSNEITILGISSTILFDDDLNCKKVSLINMVDWKDNGFKDNLLSQLIANGNIEVL